MEFGERLIKNTIGRNFQTSSFSRKKVVPFSAKCTIIEVDKIHVVIN